MFSDTINTTNGVISKPLTKKPGKLSLNVGLINKTFKPFGSNSKPLGADGHAFYSFGVNPK